MNDDAGDLSASLGSTSVLLAPAAEQSVRIEANRILESAKSEEVLGSGIDSIQVIQLKS